MWDLAKYFHVSFPNLLSSSAQQKANHVLSPNQGKTLLDNRKRMASMELTEGFTSQTPASPQEKLVADSLTSLQGIQDEYQKQVGILNEMVGVYNQSLTDVVNRMQSSLAGKNIIIGETVYYVNQYGYARKYGLKTGNVWLNRPQTCGTAYPLVQDVPLERLGVMVGPDMKTTSICGYEGKNVKYNNQFVYVKFNGEVLQYADGVKVGDIAGCPVSVVDITSQENAQTIWSGLLSDMTSVLTPSTTCVEELDPEVSGSGEASGVHVREAIQKQQDKVLALSKQIRDQIQVIRGDIQRIQSESGEQQTNLEQYLVELNNIQTRNENTKSDEKIDTIQAMTENTFMIERQNYLQYIAYVVIVVVCFGLIYFLGQSVGGVTSQIAQGIQSVGEQVQRFGVGAPRQSVLRREMEGTSAIGGIGLGLPSFSLSTPSPANTPATTPA